MKPKLLYTTINILSLLSALVCAYYVIMGLVGLVVGKMNKAHELVQWLGVLFGLLVLTTVLYALWDIGTRLIRLEQTQELILRRMNEDRETHPDPNKGSGL